MENYQQNIQKLVKKYFEGVVLSVKYVGGGFYGRVFLVSIDKNPYKVIVKIYLVKGLNDNEAKQLKVLKNSATLAMPNIYFSHKYDDDIKIDALCMEFLQGANAGMQYFIFNKNTKERIANQVIDNLLSFHNTFNEQGFGLIGSENYSLDWEEFYLQRAKKTLDRAKILYKTDKLPQFIYDVMEKAYAKSDIIFNEKVKKASLVHGDYNMWNLLYDKKTKNIIGCIDPYNCMWADREYDLYQLENANGNSFKLLANYAQKHKLSKNFEHKKAFYCLFTEIQHYCDSGLGSMKKYYSYAKNMAKKLMEL